LWSGPYGRAGSGADTDLLLQQTHREHLMSGAATLARVIGNFFAALGSAWWNLWFRPSSTKPLEICRIGVGALLLVQYTFVTPDILEYFGDSGWMTREALFNHYYNTDTMVHPDYVQSIFFYFKAPWQWIAFHILFLFCCLAFMLGWRTSWVKWVVLVGKISYGYRNPAPTYGADSILCILIFLMCFAPIGRALSLDRVREVRAAKRDNLMATVPEYKSAMAGAVLLLIQFQMAVLFFYSATMKLQYPHWWSGDAIWLVATLPDYYNHTLLTFLANHYWLSAAGTYGTLLIEVAYPFLIWQRATRPDLLCAAIFLHLMFAIFMQLVFFAFSMIVGHLSFVRPEWLRSLGAWWKQKIGAMEMIYDGHCGFCVRSMAWFLAFDGLQQISIRDFRTNPSPVVSDAQLEKALYLVLPDGRALPGFEAYRYVVLRVPGLWWLVPFFYTPVLSRMFGRPIYNWIASHRGWLSGFRWGVPRSSKPVAADVSHGQSPS
jgi:predicted DCC family thiol-disulfide oxidoreductase YuxK